jgi:hypothetical protein
VGKSLFAVQLAESLARGRKIGAFRMPGYRRRTLYLDLVMSPAKFRLRYSHFPPGGLKEARAYEFSESLFRASPPAGKAMGEWLRKKIKDDRMEVVIIDDLAALKQTDDGTAESLRVMRELKNIVDELGVSILVLASSCPPARAALVAESDLRRTRAICNIADSVFALGYHPRSPGSRYFVQTRSRNAGPIWDEANTPVCRIGLSDEMMLSFTFEGRFAAQLDPEVQQLICEIKAAKDTHGVSFRQIAKDMNTSLSRVRRLYDKWSPEMELENSEFEIENEEFGAPNEMSEPTAAGGEPGTDGCSGYDDADDENESDDEYLREIGMDVLSEDENPKREMDVTRIPFAAGLRRRSVYDLEAARNAYDHEIFVEEWGSSDRPNIWYEFTRQGVLTKSIRGTAGIQITNLGKTHFL